jgi:cysteine synthase A
MPMTTATPPRGRIYDDITQTIGGTPLVRLSRLAGAESVPAEILAKLEYFNPAGSVKDRIGVAMIDALHATGCLPENCTLIEPTSGNTGIAFAFAGAARGLPVIVCMPEGLSEERRRMMAFLGARIELTDQALGISGAIARANELAAEIPGAVIPQQFEHPANPEIHAQTTAEEIIVDTGGRLDVLVVGVGTGGTLTGCARRLKAHDPAIRIVAVEPEDSAVLSGGEPGPHTIQGIGAGFVPAVLDTSLIDEVLTIGNETAYEMARRCAAIEGVPAGISSGAALAAACEIGQRDGMGGKRIVTILPSFAERYLSTPLFDGL